jgi:hypothetical protein
MIKLDAVIWVSIYSNSYSCMALMYTILNSRGDFEDKIHTIIHS